MARCGSLDVWNGILAHLAAVADADPADLIVFDTLANLWPVRDENSAAEVGAALAAVHRLTPGRAVLLVHHLRKSDGLEGTGSRGSGALAGFVDVIVELRRLRASADPSQRKRALTGYGRYDAIPGEWVVELVAAAGGGAARPAFEHRPPKPDAAAREEREEARQDELRQALLWVIPTAEEGGGRTRKEIWDALPETLRVNEKRFWDALADGCGTDWIQEGTGGRGNPYRYRRAPETFTEGEMFGGDGLPD
jgi:hypothetical protein